MEATSAGTGFVVLIWVLTSISSLIVGLRVLAKVKINQFRLDDILTIIALVCTFSKPPTLWIESDRWPSSLDPGYRCRGP